MRKRMNKSSGQNKKYIFQPYFFFIQFFSPRKTSTSCQVTRNERRERERKLNVDNWSWLKYGSM